MTYRLLGALWAVALCATASAVAEPINFETPHVSPLALSPDGAVLAACNTMDSRIEFFDVTSGTPTPLGAIPVGYNPVSVRFRSSTEVWAVNHLSDSVSVVDLTAGRVVATIQTLDEPCDVVFAGTPTRAFVSCSAANTIQVFDPEDLSAPLAAVLLPAEDPRQLAVSNDGQTVYAAIFESGNGTTVLGGGSADTSIISFPPNVVDDSDTPHGVVNPAPNNGAIFDPPRNPAAGTPPKVGLIVRIDEQGAWRDDTGADWTRWVSGDRANKSGRPQGWTLLDHDIAAIDATTLEVDFIDRLMNANMALAVHPQTGRIGVVGTDATNEIRFEPKVNGTFLRVQLALAGGAAPKQVLDLNPHLDYTTPNVAQSLRNRSIGDPRAIAWTPDGTRAYIAGMGSNNLVVIDDAGERLGTNPIEIGEGPTGLALDAVSGRLYVLNRFAAEIAVVDTASNTVTARRSFFDATPEAVRVGRRHLYDTHATSGLGHVSCGSCHIDARWDRLGWDLGDPAGNSKALTGLNLGAGIPAAGLNAFRPFHPMKGPMTTQTLLDIIGREPHHWRGDRRGIEEFNPAYVGLLGDDAELSAAEMQQFEDYLATLHYPPNPFRNLDNTLPTSLPLDGHYATGRFQRTAGTPLPNGNAVNGLSIYRLRKLDRGVAACVTCHALPAGDGTSHFWNGSGWSPYAPGPKGERNLALVSIDGSTNVSLKVPHLRALYDKVGMNMVHTESRSGFGFAHDGAIDTIERFVSEEAFDVASDQEVADLTALMLAFSGSDFNVTPQGGAVEPPGEPSRDVHAAVGQQVTVNGTPESRARANVLANVAAGSPRLELALYFAQGGVPRGGLRTGNGAVQLDRAGEQQTLENLLALAGPGAELTLLVLPAGEGVRLALDRDGDGDLNYDEVLAGTDPTDPENTPEGEGSAEGEPAWAHSADYLAPYGVLNLSELLRVIQLFNTGTFCCAAPGANSPDGYQAGACESKDCAPHSSDYDAPEPSWSISLSELLRAIQFYNAGGYFQCDALTPDGYCPGKLAKK